MTLPRSQRHLLVRGGTLVTMDGARRVVEEDVLVTDGRIAAVGRDLDVPPATRLLDARGLHVLPGLIQGHIHLGQTLCRGLAEGRELLPWLGERIWPLEAAHTEESAYWSALLGGAECLLSGTTTIQDIGLVRGMEGVYRGIHDIGLRAVAGKCLMDVGEGAPSALLEAPRAALAEAEALIRTWSGQGRGRIQGAVCPRFILSCSARLWEGAAALAGRLGVPLHTHLLESEMEEEAVRRALGTSQMEFLDRVGVLDTDLRIAHGVWLEEPQVAVLRGRPLSVVHCPSSNLKLGSGIADLVFLKSQKNLALGIGCDGAACNNTLDVLAEMRLAGLLQAVRRGPGEFSALEVLELATLEGARALGQREGLGSLEPGKLGDILVLDLRRPATVGAASISVYDRIVYGAAREAVKWVVVDGEVLVQDGRLVAVDVDEIVVRAGEEATSLAARAGIA